MITMKFRKPVHQMRKVDADDYDGMCALVAWCGGRAVDEDDYVIAVPAPNGENRARSGDWIIQDTHGRFHVYKQPRRSR